MEYNPKIGAFVLEILTTGMYRNPLDSVREYIQNASDSILEAEEEGLFRQKEGLIEIHVKPEKRNLIIRDNGTGITSDEVFPSLINIGMSKKKSRKKAGFRGIGRLAGIAYCEKLTFRTSHNTENKCSIIEFDCLGIKKAISPSMKNVEELSNVVKINTRPSTGSSKKGEHFFEVKLEGIGDQFEEFLDCIALEKYISQVAPVEYDSHRFLFATKIERWAEEHGINIPTVKLIIKTPDNMDRQVFKAYKGHFMTKRGNYDIHINDVGFYPENFSNETPFWMWYSKTDLLGMFNEERVAGLRFRKNNIAIGGPDGVEELFPGKEGRLNRWLMGEIHVLADEIIPNNRRDGFEHNEKWLDLCNHIDPFIKRHCQECHNASVAPNRPIAKIVSSANSTLKFAKEEIVDGFLSNEQKNDLLKKVSKERKRLESALKKRRTPEETKKIKPLLDEIVTLENSIKNETQFALKKIKTNLNRKQINLLKDVLETMRKTITSVDCNKSYECFKKLKSAILEKYKI